MRVDQDQEGEKLRILRIRRGHCRQILGFVLELFPTLGLVWPRFKILACLGAPGEEIYRCVGTKLMEENPGRLAPVPGDKLSPIAAGQHLEYGPQNHGLAAELSQVKVFIDETVSSGNG